MKSYLHISIDQKRLKNMVILHHHKERTNTLKMVKVANEFIRIKYLANFRRFEEVDKNVRSVLFQVRSLDCRYSIQKLRPRVFCKKAFL